MERHGGELDGRKFVPLGKTRHFPAGRRITALLFYQAFGTKENIQLLTLPGGKYSDLSLRKCLLLSHLAQSPVPGTSGPQCQAQRIRQLEAGSLELGKALK